MFLIVLLIVNVLSIFVCHWIARKRGLAPVFWGVMGAVFGPLAIPFAYISRPTG